MNWKKYSLNHSSHAFLAPSRAYWLNYDDEKLERTFRSQQNIVLGTMYHELAARMISLKVFLPENEGSLNSFVNDAIRFNMRPEQVLFYSQYCFGTADAIVYTNRLLRIHDLKTGKTKASMTQLKVYAALFCLDYKEKPEFIILRIYQDDEIYEENVEYSEILEIMSKIVDSSRLLESIEEEYGIGDLAWR